LSSAGATTSVVVVEILPSARKHGITDDDIRPALENAVASITVADQPGFSMVLGPNQSAQLLEIGLSATTTTTT